MPGSDHDDLASLLGSRHVVHPYIRSWLNPFHTPPKLVTLMCFWFSHLTSCPFMTFQHVLVYNIKRKSWRFPKECCEFDRNNFLPLIFSLSFLSTRWRQRSRSQRSRPGMDLRKSGLSTKMASPWVRWDSTCYLYCVISIFNVPL